jgi:2-oxoglutarate ferredoxin oxidoreductase subunit gamma
MQHLTEIRVAGFGGQGVIMLASVIGKAASIFEGNFATMTQNFGPEARGGACSAQVVLSDSPVLYPYITHPDLMVVMSQEAYVKFAAELKPGGTMLIEQDLVRVQGLAQGVKVYGIPATRLAEQLGKRMVSNIVMTGFFGAITGLLSRKALEDAVADSVPKAFRELNVKAFEMGYEYGVNHLATGELKLETEREEVEVRE